MSSTLPPVPPGSRSDKGPKGADTQAGHVPDHRAPTGQGQKANPDKIGQAGNTKVNTTNQGYQQDR